MNGRRLFREYAQSKGKEAKEFVKIKKESYVSDVLITKDNNGSLEKTTLCYEDMIHWIIKNKKMKKNGIE